MTDQGVFGSLRKNRIKLLTIGVVVSLVLNVVLLAAWVLFAVRVGQASDAVDTVLEQAIADIGELQESSIEVTVDIDEAVDFAADFPIDQVFTIRLDTEFPIKDEFTTRVAVQGPFGVDIPFTVDVPIDIAVPIQTDVEIPVSEIVKVDTEIPLQMTIPIAIAIADSAIADFLQELEKSLIDLRAALNN
jgi:hypothetical protein